MSSGAGSSRNPVSEHQGEESETNIPPASADEQTLELGTDAAVAINLQLQLLEEEYGSGDTYQDADFSAAVDCQRTMLRNILDAARDTVVSRRLDAAGNEDASAILTALEQEKQERNDREMALRLGGQESLPPGTVDFQPGQRRKCVVCLQQCYPAVTAGCTHSLCRTCLHELYSLALRDEELIPVRCCEFPLSREAAQKVLNTAQLQKYEARVKELTVCTNRLYCPKKICSAFLGSKNESHEREEKKCPICHTACCSACGLEQHVGPCKPDAAAEDEVREWAKGKNVRQCEQCRRFIESEGGCNHMTCKCGYQFCFRCGEQWKLGACQAEKCNFLGGVEENLCRS